MATQEARNVIVTDDRITNANLLDLVDGGATTLHSHSGGGDTLTDRGDTTAWDLQESGMTTNGNWIDWDVSGIVPAGATAVKLSGYIQDDAVASFLQFRKNGNTDVYNRQGVSTQVANQIIYFSFDVFCDANRVVEYRTSNLTFTAIKIAVVGWYV